MKMKLKDVLIMNSVIFASVFIMHLLRFILKTPLKIGSLSIPIWFSVPAVILAGFLAWQNWTALGKKNSKLVAKVLAIAFILDGFFGICFWIAKLELWGISGNTFLFIAGIEAIIAAGLLWFVFKKK